MKKDRQLLMKRICDPWLKGKEVLDEIGKVIIDEKDKESFMKRIGNPWFKGKKVFEKMTFLKW
jgi:hypothetical protein